MKRIVFNILAVILMAAFVVFLILENVFRISVPVVTAPGSYAEEFAKKHHLSQANVPDTIAVATDLRYETFEFNVDGNHITIERYKGKSVELVIPQTISGRLVTAIGEDFFDYSPDLQKVYIPDSVKEIKADPTKRVELVLSRNHKLKDELDAGDWNITTFSDSESPLFSMGDIPFEYSRTADGIRLELYTGKEDAVIVPAYIDGAPVTEVSFNMLKYDYVVFPATVKLISGATYVNLYTMVFAIGVVFTAIAFILSLIVINLRIGRFKNNTEYVLSGSQVVVTILYLVAQIGFCLWTIYKGTLNWPIVLLISVALMVCYLAYVLMGETGRKHAIAVQEKNETRTSQMREITLSVAHLADDIKDLETKKAVTRVVEEIKYSDQTTVDSLAGMEERIKQSIEELKTAIDSGEKEEIISKCGLTMKAVKERNEMCKARKGM